MKISEYLASQGFASSYALDPQVFNRSSMYWRKDSLELYQPTEQEESFMFVNNVTGEITFINTLEEARSIIQLYADVWIYNPSLEIRIKERELEYRVRHFSRMLDLQIVRLTFGHLSRTVLQNLNTYENQ